MRILMRNVILSFGYNFKSSIIVYITCEEPKEHQIMKLGKNRPESEPSNDVKFIDLFYST